MLDFFCKPNTSFLRTVKNCGSSIISWCYFSSSCTEELLRADDKMDGKKLKKESSSLFIFLQDRNLKHTAKAIQEWLSQSLKYSSSVARLEHGSSSNLTERK